MNIRLRYVFYVCLAVISVGLLSCSKSESYSNLLKDEEHAVNWFLAQKRVEVEIPEDSISFETGKDAPFYKLDEDGNVYMQVIDKGVLSRRPKTGDRVYFRFTRRNIKLMSEGAVVTPEGNSDNLASGIGPTSFVYGDLSLPSSSQYGSGIQQPLDFLGYDCEVNIVLKSYYGITSEQTNCIPYLMNIRYFKAEY